MHADDLGLITFNRQAQLIELQIATQESDCRPLRLKRLNIVIVKRHLIKLRLQTKHARVRTWLIKREFG